jgi:hypothetical protein
MPWLPNIQYVFCAVIVRDRSIWQFGNVILKYPSCRPADTPPKPVLVGLFSVLYHILLLFVLV